LLRLFGLSTSDPGALTALRLLGLAVGLGQLVLVAACLRLLFPGQWPGQLIGLVLAAFLPVHIYLCHYITNESLLMLLGTAAIYLTLRLLRQPFPAVAGYAALGLCLGAGLLTKITAVVVTGVILLVLAGKLLVARERRPGVWFRTVGMTALVAVLVSGWHYARVWARFGTPLVGNFDSTAGFLFWQDPGYGTFAYLSRFGQALIHPFFSALYSLPDGLYSTFWGDGLCAGASTWTYRPPWNYDFMAAGYLLALVPTLFIAAGLLVALVNLVRQPCAAWFLILGLAGGLAMALLYQFICFPYHGHTKAIYEVTGMISFCTLAALGFDSLFRLNRLLGSGLLILFGTWACTAYVSYWISPSSADTQIWVGLQQQAFQRSASAQASFQNALRIDPHCAPAQLDQAGMLIRAGRFGETRRLFDQVLGEDPDNPDALFGLAFVYQAQGQVNQSLELLRRASELAPDLPVVHSVLGGTLARQNRLAEAIVEFREALRVAPSDPGDHANLGLLLTRTGHTAEALEQYRRALGLRSDQAPWLAELAWILATREELRYRDPSQALRLAQQACERTAYQDLACLQALAAAQAASGRYREALQTARCAVDSLGLSPQPARMQSLTELVRRCNQARPFYSREPLRAEPYPSVRALNGNEKPWILPPG
jgi:Tfp pilus assembly protein PilF